MSPDEMRALVRRVTYKPGWKIEVRDGIHGCPELYVTAEVVDVRDGSSRADLQQTRAINGWDLDRWSEYDVKYQLIHMIRSIELHELCEWLKLDGVCLEDPHPPGSPAF